MSETFEISRPTCVLCDRPLPGGASAVDPSVGFCAACAAEMGVVPTEDALGLDRAAADRLPLGYITLDAAGTVLAFNAVEARASGLRPEEVVGRDFFRDVAPCTGVKDFAGRYAEMVERGRAAVDTFRYVFRFAGGERLVQIYLAYLPWRREGLILVREPGHA